MLRFCEAFTEAVSGDMQTFDRVFTEEDGLFIAFRSASASCC